MPFIFESSENSVVMSGSASLTAQRRAKYQRENKQNPKNALLDAS